MIKASRGCFLPVVGKNFCNIKEKDAFKRLLGCFSLDFDFLCGRQEENLNQDSPAVCPLAQSPLRATMLVSHLYYLMH